jgi:hypothetical protein
MKERGGRPKLVLPHFSWITQPSERGEAEQTCLAEHLALDQLQAVDVALGLAVALGQG